MNVTELRAPSRAPLARGTVVVMNSDDAGWAMTVRDHKNGQVYCRWHDDAGLMQGDWFYPEELTLCTSESEVVFTDEFSASK